MLAWLLQPNGSSPSRNRVLPKATVQDAKPLLGCKTVYAQASPRLLPRNPWRKFPNLPSRLLPKRLTISVSLRMVVELTMSPIPWFVLAVMNPTKSRCSRRKPSTSICAPEQITWQLLLLQKPMDLLVAHR